MILDHVSDLYVGDVLHSGTRICHLQPERNRLDDNGAVIIASSYFLSETTYVADVLVVFAGFHVLPLVRAFHPLAGFGSLLSLLDSGLPLRASMDFTARPLRFIHAFSGPPDYWRKS